jgi:hypothetical protein
MSAAKLAAAMTIMTMSSMETVSRRRRPATLTLDVHCRA